MRVRNWKGLYVLAAAVIAALILDWKNMTSNLDDLFIGALGLLTFISIFYNLTILKEGEKMLIGAKKLIKKQKATLTDRIIKSLVENKDNSDMRNVKKFASKIQGIDDVGESLNMNAWLVVSVLSFFISIMSYVLKGGNTFVIAIKAALQVITFWIGLASSATLVVVWFILRKYAFKKI